MRKCETCRYAAQGQHSLYCHAVPPTVLMEPAGTHTSTFPPVSPNMWCRVHAFSVIQLLRKLWRK